MTEKRKRSKRVMAPQWLFDHKAKLVNQVLELRRHRGDRSVLDRSTTAIGKAVRRKRLLEDLRAIRTIAEGGGHVEHNAERQVCKVFWDAWVALGPSRSELSKASLAMVTRKPRVSVTQAASAVARVSRLAADHVRLAGVGAGAG